MSLNINNSPALHRNPTDTEVSAALAVAPHVTHLRRKVFEFIAGRGEWGATGWEVYSRTGIWIYTVKPRITELKKMNLVADNSQRRRNGNGQMEIVYVLTRIGKVYAQKEGINTGTLTHYKIQRADESITNLTEKKGDN